jgi:acetylornithine aminotransferase
VAAAASLAMIGLIDRPEMLRRIRTLGTTLTEGLLAMDGVEAVRGRGLMLGIQLTEGIVSADVNAELLSRGLVANAPRPDSLRLLPPFVLTDEQAERALELISCALIDQ